MAKCKCLKLNLPIQRATMPLAHNMSQQRDTNSVTNINNNVISGLFFFCLTQNKQQCSLKHSKITQE